MRHDSNLPMKDAEEAVAEARHLFNEEKFWHVHEALERIWLKRHGDEKALLQGLIIGAASLVHWQKEEFPVCWRMMADAVHRLEGKQALYYGWDVAAFRAHLQKCAEAKVWHSHQV
jgi:predicted metal-dependent hydrolase